jgi:hypothetical protein
MSNIDNELLVEEYKYCRALILKDIDIMEKNEIYVTGACAVIFVFSLQAPDHIVSVVAAWLPPFIACLGWLRFSGLDGSIDEINGYLAKLEASHPALNWTTYYLANDKRALRRTRQVLWAALTFFTLVGAAYLTCWHK